MFVASSVAFVVFASLVDNPLILLFFFFFFFWVEESLHAHRCQSYQQSERQIKQTTGDCRVHSTSFKIL